MKMNKLSICAIAAIIIEALRLKLAEHANSTVDSTDSVEGEKSKMSEKKNNSGMEMLAK